MLLNSFDEERFDWNDCSLNLDDPTISGHPGRVDDESQVAEDPEASTKTNNSSPSFTNVVAPLMTNLPPCQTSDNIVDGWVLCRIKAFELGSFSRRRIVHIMVPYSLFERNCGSVWTGNTSGSSRERIGRGPQFCLGQWGGGNWDG
ncbi:hypothetical protein BS47DRAFT_1343841 [Hydnum rufescens UP504]|uniref:Uncharacterized protein n=1 Tax=Hydnum rufescens UP504 TaxID=1448309 RepID=A0A9P6DWP0_9AGAM|nr:hypothetical protein BS47DRAFT_1343841 [Hydnum rufescens UP504]